MPNIKYSSRTFFTYEADFDGNIAPGATEQIVFNTHGDSDFFWQKFAAFALVTDSGTTRQTDQLPALYISVTNQTTGRSFQQKPVPIPNISWNGQFLPMVTVWPRKSSMLITLTNFQQGGHTTYSMLQLSFLGTKAFT